MLCSTNTNEPRETEYPDLSKELWFIEVNQKSISQDIQKCDPFKKNLRVSRKRVRRLKKKRSKPKRMSDFYVMVKD